MIDRDEDVPEPPDPNPATTIRERPGVTVYWSPRRNIVIRQLDPTGDGESVLIHPDDVPELARILEEVVSAGAEPEDNGP
jgi:hypothetical protein